MDIIPSVSDGSDGCLHGTGPQVDIGNIMWLVHAERVCMSAIFALLLTNLHSKYDLRVIGVFGSNGTPYRGKLVICRTSLADDLIIG